MWVEKASIKNRCQRFQRGFQRNSEMKCKDNQHMYFTLMFEFNNEIGEIWYLLDMLGKVGAIAKSNDL